AGIGSNVLTRALGIEDQVEVDVTDELLEAGDVFLFCSDGLTSMLPDNDIERLVNHYYPDLEAAVERLVVGALSSGGLDNITVVMAQPEIEGK
ncbi:MAG: SpoIIE family protein phosphatase, partial [Gammaproteobacteria bacterium]|nr:SpoIIE family protein phosphatase [Gammaproteobacteria bacterium]